MGDFAITFPCDYKKIFTVEFYIQNIAKQMSVSLTITITLFKQPLRKITNKIKEITTESKKVELTNNSKM